jgi:Leucine-rich repeat (LRR) protein
METVNLKNRGLLEIPNMQGLPLQGIVLEGNNLVSLDNLPSTIKHLNAGYNRLDAEGILHVFPFLETLNLDHNFINLYDEDDFAGSYRSVKEVNLRFNKIKYTGWLRNTQIEDLQITANPLSLLANLPSSLKALKAGMCSITMIQSRLPPRLETLFLARNTLRFAGLPLNWGSCLKELHLDSNQIERFPRKLPDTLTYLSLNNNYLESLPSVLPASLQDLFVQSNRLRSIPAYERKLRTLLLDDNHLIEIPNRSIASIFSAKKNWNEQIHHQSQIKIKQCWKRYVFTLRLRHYKRVNMVREELCAVSMMPERWEQIDVVDPVWFRKVPCHNRSHLHSG